jgi:cytochrome c oxidase accessory protein FixG
MKSLPVLDPRIASRIETSEGSLGRDGRRRRPYPADVHGRFLRARRAVYWLLIALWAALPWIPIHGHPAVFLDVERRQFFLFGASFNAQDVWLAFFALTGVGFGLLFVTALLGRVWCGWACPQTVFLEAVFRPIERVINGPRNVFLRRKERGGVDHAWRVAATHASYVVAAVLVAHILLAYFVSLPHVFAMVRARPSAHPEAFAWTAAVTLAMYGNFAFFREQLCVVVCPYGRLQSVLIDDDSLVVGYDEKRGEPRGKATNAQSGAGDCVDCKRCVVVCPTAIDIREGLQLDCVACTACIDACDEVMDRLGRPPGLIRYDSLRGLRGEGRRILRPRVWGYAILLLVGVVVAFLAARKHEPFESNIVRLAGAPYTREGGALRNAFELHVVNKQSETMTFAIEPISQPDLAFVVPIRDVRIEPLGDRRLPVFVTMDQSAFVADRPFEIAVRVVDPPKGADKRVRAIFLGAK